MSDLTIFWNNVPLPLPDGVEYLDIFRPQSLLDADIVVLRPEFHSLNIDGRWQNRRSLSENASFKAIEAVEHFSERLQQAVQSGTTVIYLLPEREIVNYDSGERSHSGTGRNRHTTRLMGQLSNYRFIPLTDAKHDPKFVNGKKIVRTKDSSLIDSIFSKFQKYWQYNCTFKADTMTPLLQTKSGKLPVAAVSAQTNVVLLPDLKFGEEEVFYWDHSDDQEYATEDGEKLSKQFLSEIVSIHKSLKSKLVMSPPPSWISDQEFTLPNEKTLRNRVAKIDTQIHGLREKKASLEKEIEENSLPQALLYETGHRLEAAVRSALKLIGFKVSHFEKDGSEFDAVFESDEGRFIAEVEGKNTAINVKKISQLRRNVDEDFSRDEVEEPALGVLFGNAFRATPPAERKGAFTEKVVSSAPALGIALVDTTDLFFIVRTILENPSDDELRLQCRRAFADSVGEQIQFPKK